MRSHRTSRSFASRTIAVWIISLSWMACGEDLIAPQTGVIRVTAATTGSAPDPDGYGLMVDNGEPQAIGVNAAIIFTALTIGEHRLELTGVADGCAVTGENPLTVTVTAGVLVEVAFAITCVAPPGSLTITTATTGVAPDPDGYTFRLDEAPEQAIGTNASIMVADLAPGPHAVALGGLAENCQVEGDNPRTVEVPNGGPATVGFGVACPGVQQWTPMASGTEADLPEVWGSSSADVFVVGELPVGDDGEVASVVLRYDGTEWRQQLRQADLVLRGVWGSGPSNVFAVGLDFFSAEAKVLRYDGVAWTDVPGFASDGFEQLGFESVWGSSADDVFAVGFAFDGEVERSLIFHFDGSSWQRMPGPGPIAPALLDVWGSSAEDVYAVGRDDEADPATGVILRYDGAAWSPVVQEQGLSLNSIWGSSASDVFAAGFRVEEEGDEFVVVGMILHFDGTRWSPMSLPETGVLHGIWGSSARDVFAVGDDGAVLHYDGLTWTRTVETTGALLGVWVGSPSDAFAVGTGGTILHGTP